jgi:hypothetical protein
LTTTGLVFGDQVVDVAPSGLDLDFWNYLQDDSITADGGSWDVAVEPSVAGQSGVTVRLLGDSGIYRTSRAPYQLGAELSGPDRVGPGERCTLDVRLLSRQAVDIGDVHVGASDSDCVVQQPMPTVVDVPRTGVRTTIDCIAPTDVGQAQLVVVASSPPPAVTPAWSPVASSEVLPAPASVASPARCGRSCAGSGSQQPPGA